MKQVMQKWLCLLLVLPMLLFTGCGLFGGGDGKLHAGYYREVIMLPDGELIGRDPISESEANKGGLVFKVTMNDKDQPTSVLAMRSGEPVDSPWPDPIPEIFSLHCAEIVVSYDEDGKTYEWRDEKGEPMSSFLLSKALRFKEDEKKQVTTAYLYRKKGKLGADKTGFAAQFSYERDEKGRISKIRFMNEDGSPAVFRNENGSEVYFTYDDKEDDRSAAQENQTFSIASLIHSKEERMTSLLRHVGLGKKKEDRLSSQAWRDDKGASARGMSWCEARYSYDDAGRLVKVEHINADGEPWKGSRGEAEKRYVGAGTKWYRPNEKNFDWASGWPLNSYRNFELLRFAKPTYGAETEYIYEDKSPYPSAIRFKTDNGGYGENKIAGYRLKHDEMGYVTELSAEDAGGNLTPFVEKDIDTVKFSYGEKGRLSSVAFFAKGNPITFAKELFEGDTRTNVAKIAYAYDEAGKLISESYFDIAGNAAELRAYGTPYAKIGFTYDDKGKKKLSFFGKDNQSISIEPFASYYGTWIYSQGDGRTWKFDISKDNLVYTFNGGGVTLISKGPYDVQGNHTLYVDFWNGYGTLNLNWHLEDGREMPIHLKRETGDTRLGISWFDSHYAFTMFEKM